MRNRAASFADFSFSFELRKDVEFSTASAQMLSVVCSTGLDTSAATRLETLARVGRLQITETDVERFRRADEAGEKIAHKMVEDLLLRADLDTLVNPFNGVILEVSSVKSKVGLQYFLTPSLGPNAYEGIVLRGVVYLLPHNSYESYMAPIPDDIRTRNCSLVPTANRKYAQVRPFLCAVASRHIFALGLDGSAQKFLMQAYDTVKNSWGRFPDLPPQRREAKLGVWTMGRLVYAAAGCDRVFEMDSADPELGWRCIMVRLEEGKSTQSLDVACVQVGIDTSMLLLGCCNMNEYNEVKVYILSHEERKGKMVATWRDHATTIGTHALRLYQGRKIYGLRRDRCFDTKKLQIEVDNFVYY